LSTQTQQIKPCCQNKKAYTITYSKKNNEFETINICNTCFNIEGKSKDYPDTLIKRFQKDAFKIICNTCNENVTATMGCKTCHPESFSNLENLSENKS